MALIATLIVSPADFVGVGGGRVEDLRRPRAREQREARVRRRQRHRPGREEHSGVVRRVFEGRH